MKFLEFNKDDYTIHNREKLDRILVELCRHVIQGQQDNPEKYGMVGACVLDPKNRKTVGVSEHTKHGVHHAERVAMNDYVKKYGDIPTGSIILTTLSPCNEDNTNMADERFRESCTDLINNSTVKKVYCGYMDPSQHNEHNEYTLEATKNNDIQGLCKQLADTFLKDDPMEDASGVIATKAQAKDPRYSMSLTKDVRPGQVEKNLKAFSLEENFSDGKNPGRKGLAKRSGVNTKASVSSLRKTAKHSTGEKQRMAHWLANMKAGRAKKK